MNKPELALYRDLLGDIRSRVRLAQARAARSVNTEMILLYWDIGCMILERQKEEGWGTGVIPRLAVDLKNELPEEKGFSARNIGYMIRFAREYGVPSILQRPVAESPQHAVHSDKNTKTQSSILQRAAAKSEKVPSDASQPIANKTLKDLPHPVEKCYDPVAPSIMQRVVAQLPWGHNIILIEKIKDFPTRLWYAQEALEQGWSRDTLTVQIKNRAHERQGGAVTNFEQTLPSAHAEIAGQLLKDPYVFDFLTMAEPFQERELEVGLLGHIQKFLLELGRGFAPFLPAISPRATLPPRATSSGGHMSEAWDKDNPPEEFWGSSILTEIFVLRASSPNTMRLGTWLSYASIPVSIGLVAAILFGYYTLFAGLALLQMTLLLGGWVCSQKSNRAIMECMNDGIHSLYYLFGDDSFRVRVDSTGPLTPEEMEDAELQKGTFRFTQDDVNALSISEQLVHLPQPWKQAKAIRLVFTLHGGKQYRHDQLLAPVSVRGEDADSRRFLELLDRLERILGADRIESAESLMSARDAVRRRWNSSIGR